MVERYAVTREEAAQGSDLVSEARSQLVLSPLRLPHLPASAIVYIAAFYLPILYIQVRIPIPKIRN